MHRVSSPSSPSGSCRCACRSTEKRYEIVEQRAQFFTDLLERVRALPGVNTAARQQDASAVRRPRRPRDLPGQGGEGAPRAVNETSADYHRSVNATLVAGRRFTGRTSHPPPPRGRQPSLRARYLPRQPDRARRHLPISADDQESKPTARSKSSASCGHPQPGCRQRANPEIPIPYTINGERL